MVCAGSDGDDIGEVGNPARGGAHATVRDRGITEGLEGVRSPTGNRPVGLKGKGGVTAQRARSGDAIVGRRYRAVRKSCFVGTCSQVRVLIDEDGAPGRHHRIELIRIGAIQPVVDDRVWRLRRYGDDLADHILACARTEARWIDGSGVNAVEPACYRAPRHVRGESARLEDGRAAD